MRELAKEIDGPIAVKNLSAAAIAESGGVRVAFMRAFGLVFGAFDFVITPEGYPGRPAR